MSTTIEEPTLDMVAQRLGRRIAELRTARRLTLDEFAGKIGFTKGYLSKIENGRQVPPIGTLIKLAQGLGTEISDLLEGDSPSDLQKDVCIVRSWQQAPASRGDEYDYVALAQTKRHKHMEPFVMTMNEHVGREFAEHDGEEFMFVLNGEVEWEMEIDGKKKTWVLSKGDSCYFNSRLPHRGRSVKGESNMLLVIYRPDQV